MLGVTPELVAMAWPAGSTVLAVDREPAMIAALFPPGPDRRAVVGEWLALPAADGAIDAVVGDGCASLFACPDGYRALAAELARACAPGGCVILRLFVLPPRRESLADIAAALAAGAIGSIDVLKWRLAMALAGDDRSVEMSAILGAFDAIVPDRAALAAATGWPRSVIDHLDTYRVSRTRLAFPTLAESIAALAPAFARHEIHTPGYELGDRCPTLVLRR